VAGFDFCGYGQGFEVDDGDVVVGGAGYEGSGAVGIHEDAGGSVADGQPLDGFASGGVDDDQIGASEKRDEDEFAVEGKLQAVGALDVGGESLDYGFRVGIEDGDGAVLSVRYPDLFAVGGDVEALGAVADFDYGLVPVGSRAAGGRAGRRASASGLTRTLAGRRTSGR